MTEENDANLMMPGRAYVPTGSKTEQVKDGGPGSGNFGHEGRPGEVGGSGEGGGSSSKTSETKSPSKIPTTEIRGSESPAERHARHVREEEEETKGREKAERAHEAGVKAGKFPEPSKEDIESNRQAAKDIVGEVHDEYGRQAALRQYEGIIRDIERGRKGDGGSDFSWTPGRMLALKEEYERELKIKK
jgi:hypothetical protein